MLPIIMQLHIELCNNKQAKKSNNYKGWKHECTVIGAGTQDYPFMQKVQVFYVRSETNEGTSTR